MVPARSVTHEYLRIAAPRLSVTDRAWWWATVQVSLNGRAVSDISSELGANWHAIDDAVMAYATALLDADHNRNCAVEAPDEELTEVVDSWGLLWDEVAMDEREQQRKMRHRLGVLWHAEEVSGSVAATCRYYGISRRCFYKWKHRFTEFGEEGLRDRFSVPHRSPNQTKSEIVGKIIYLRSSYHFGPQKTAMYLRRYHGIEISP